MGGLFRGSLWGLGGDKVAPTHPCLKPVRIMLKASNLARKHTPICSSRKYFLTKFFVKIFWHCFVSLKFSYWSKLHVNIITGSRIMTIFFYKGLIRNLEIGNTSVWFCPISADWGELWIPNVTQISLIACY